MNSKKRLLSGIQATGKIHLGNYFGAVKNWVAMQADYEAFFMVADLHALTTAYEDGISIKNNSYEVIADLLACGIDPNQAALFIQSKLPEHSELHLILSMITPLPWLERIPTYKSKREEIKDKDLNTYGFLGYPVLQAADIMVYQANVVPVGKDQAPHVELTREIARRFNFLFKTEFFIEPEEKFTQFLVIPGTDGRKMSKSYGNAIYFADSEEVIKDKVMKMVTDPARQKRTDVGNPEICPLFSFQEIFNPDLAAEISEQCHKAGIGCVDCKKKLLGKMNDFVAPIREKRERYILDKSNLDDLINIGTQKAKVVARNNLEKVKDIVKI